MEGLSTKADTPEVVAETGNEAEGAVAFFSASQLLPVLALMSSVSFSFLLLLSSPLPDDCDASQRRRWLDSPPSVRNLFRQCGQGNPGLQTGHFQSPSGVFPSSRDKHDV